MPVLAQVGDEWHRGPARIAHEHLMSSTMRNILGSFLRLYARPDVSTRLLFATPAGERHEVGTLGAAMLAASCGLGVAYLGPDLPAREIVESVRPAGAQVMVLGLTTTSAASRPWCSRINSDNVGDPDSSSPSTNKVTPIGGLPPKARSVARCVITPALSSAAPLP